MSEPLLLSFQSDTSGARNAIASLASTVASNMLTIGNSMKSAAEEHVKLSSSLRAIPTIANAALVGLLAVGTAYAAYRYVSSAIEDVVKHLKEMVDISNSAQKAGVGTSFFQTWTDQARLLGVETTTLVGILNKAREAATVNLGHEGKENQSSIQELLSLHVKSGNIGQGDLDAFNNTTGLEDKYRKILDLIDRLMADGKRLAAFDIAKGFFGADFENMLRNGVNVVGKMRDSLTGIEQAKWPPDILNKAKEISDELDRADKIMREAWYPIQQDIERGNQNIAKAWADIRLEIAEASAYLLSFYNHIKDISGAVDGLKGAKIGSVTVQEVQTAANLVLSPKAGLGFMSGMVGGPFAKGGIFGDPGEATTTPWAGTLEGARRVGAGMIERASKETHWPTGAMMGPDMRDLPDPSKGLPSTKKVADDAKTSLEQYMDSLRKSLVTLQAETETYGKSNQEKQRAIDLARAEDAARKDQEAGKRTSAELTDEERKKVLALADAQAKAKDQMEKLQRAQQGLNEMSQMLGNQLLSAFDKIGEKGAKATDVIKDMTKALIKAVEQALLLGTGPFANLFGTEGKQGQAGGFSGLLVGGASKFFGGAFGGGYGASDYAAAEAAAAPGMYGPAFSDGGLVGRDGKPTFIPFSALASARHFAVGGGVPAILHQGELVLNAAQQKNVAASMSTGGNVNITHAPTINGTGLSADEVFRVISQSQKEFSRQIGPILSNWQRRHGKSFA